MADRSAWKIVEDLFKDHTGHIIAMGKVSCSQISNLEPEVYKALCACSYSRQYLTRGFAGARVHSWRSPACKVKEKDAEGTAEALNPA